MCSGKFEPTKYEQKNHSEWIKSKSNLLFAKFGLLYFQASVQMVPPRLQSQLFHRHRRLRDHDGNIHGALPLLRDKAARLVRTTEILLLTSV